MQWPPSSRSCCWSGCSQSSRQEQQQQPPRESGGPQVPIHCTGLEAFNLDSVSICRPTFISHCILPQTSCNQCDLEFTHVITLKKHEKTEQIRRVPIWPVSAFATICLLLPTRCPRPPSGPQITQLQSQDLLLIILLLLLLLLYHLTKKDLPSFEIDLLVLGKY